MAKMMARSWIALATMVAVLGHARSDGAAVDRRSLLQVFESNPFPSIDLSALERIGFVPPPDLASGGSAPAPAPSPAPALEDALAALPVGDLVPVPDLSDPLGSLEASLPGLGGGGGGGDGGGDGSGTDEIVIPEGGANETTVDGSGEAVPVNGTTADDSAESEPVPSGQFDCSPTCDEAGTDLGGCEICTGDCECADPGEGPQVNNPVTPGLLPGQFDCSPTCDPTKLGGCDICTGDCECADPSRGTPPGEGPQVNNTMTPGLPPGEVPQVNNTVPTQIQLSLPQPPTPEIELKAPTVRPQAPPVLPPTPQMRPTLMDPEPPKPEVQKQFCDPNCPALAERCAECSMDCKSCLQERPTYANATGPTPTTFTGEGPQVNNPVTPGLPPGQYDCSPTCDPTKLGGCDICTGDCECADPSRGTPPGEGPQVNNPVTPGLPPGQYECKDECEGYNLGCDICTGYCECANPPKGPQTLEIVQQINGTDAVMPLFVVEVTSTKDKEKYNKTYLMPLLPGSIPCAPECLEPNYTGPWPQGWVPGIWEVPTSDPTKNPPQKGPSSVPPKLPPGQYDCSPTCDPTKLGGCDICTGDCECADPSRGTPPPKKKPPLAPPKPPKPPVPPQKPPAPVPQKNVTTIIDPPGQPVTFAPPGTFFGVNIPTMIRPPMPACVPACLYPNYTGPKPPGYTTPTTNNTVPPIGLVPNPPDNNTTPPPTNNTSPPGQVVPGIPEFAFPYTDITNGSTIGPALVSLAPTFEYRYKTGEDEPEVQPERFCLFLIGDWGRENDANQAAVAQSMDQIADYFCQPLGVLSVGDNFQQTAGLDSIVDPEFNSSFSYPYRYETLQVPWFSLLGNVDYTDTTDCGSEVENEQRECLNFRAQMKRSPEYQVDPWIRRIDPRWFADRFFSLAVSDDIEFFFADTSVFVSEYYDQPWASDVEGGLSSQDPQEQLDYLDAAMASSNATWKILLGHHPIYSNGQEGGYEEVAEALIPLMDKHRVPAYFNGHDHSQQHIMKDGRHYVTQGAGSLTHTGFQNRDPASFESDSPGFSALVFENGELTVLYFDDQGDGLYNFTVPRPESFQNAGTAPNPKRMWLRTTT